MDCHPSSRFPWLSSTISLGSPFSEYSVKNKKCCDAVNPNTPIDFDLECSLCYNSVLSLPGFMLDPNNCQKYYMCVAEADGTFTPHHMSCADCMFWDDEKLTCVEVDSSCREKSAPLPPVTGTPNPKFTKDPLISCIDFEDPNILSTKGLYVMNNGVKIVENGVNGIPANFCPQGNRCGFFNSSQLDIPFFSNNYESLPNIKITMDFYSTDTKTNGFMAIVSTNCHDASSDNSLFYGLTESLSLSYVKDTNHREYYAWLNGYKKNTWQSATAGFGGGKLFNYVENKSRITNLPNSFEGLLNSHCPMIIGSPIKRKSSSKIFSGYMDNICFYIDY